MLPVPVLAYSETKSFISKKDCVDVKIGMGLLHRLVGIGQHSLTKIVSWSAQFGRAIPNWNLYHMKYDPDNVEDVCPFLRNYLSSLYMR